MFARTIESTIPHISIYMIVPRNGLKKPSLGIVTPTVCLDKNTGETNPNVSVFGYR